MERSDLSYQALLLSVETFEEALKRCCLLGGMEAQEAAFRLGIDYKHFNRMMNPHDSRHFPPGKIQKLMAVAGNTFPLDWLERRMGRVAYPLEFMAILNEIKRSLEAGGCNTRLDLRGLSWPK